MALFCGERFAGRRDEPVEHPGVRAFRQDANGDGVAVVDHVEHRHVDVGELLGQPVDHPADVVWPVHGARLVHAERCQRMFDEVRRQDLVETPEGPLVEDLAEEPLHQVRSCCCHAVPFPVTQRRTDYSIGELIFNSRLSTKCLDLSTHGPRGPTTRAAGRRSLARPGACARCRPPPVHRRRLPLHHPRGHRLGGERVGADDHEAVRQQGRPGEVALRDGARGR